MAATTSAPAISPASPSSTESYRGPFAIMTSLFFLWGFMTVFNDILIPRFKAAFELNYFEAMLVQFAFFGAYFTGSLLYFVISAATGAPIAKDWIQERCGHRFAHFGDGQRFVLAGRGP